MGTETRCDQGLWARDRDSSPEIPVTKRCTQESRSDSRGADAGVRQ